MEEGWRSKLPAVEVGTGATDRVWGLLLFPVFGGGLPCITAQTILRTFQSQHPESVDMALVTAGSFYLEGDGPVKI